MILRFFRFYRKHIVHLWFEEIICWIVRWLPGLLGMILRWGVYRLLFKKLTSFPAVYSGVYITHTYGIEAGKSFSVNTGALIDGRGGVKIGSHVMVGPYAVIVSSTHSFKNLEKPMSTLNHEMAPVIIGDDVWIGAHAVIKGGVRIGTGVIVSAGAVVTNNVDDFQIVGGTPAKVIGDRRSFVNEQSNCILPDDIIQN